MNTANSKSRRSSLINVGSFVTLLLMWWLVTAPFGDKPLVAPLFLPSPGSVWDTFLMLIKNGYQGKSLWFHLGISLFRFGLAFTITVLVAVPLGLWMGMNETVKAVLDPPIEISRPMPKLALLPLLIIWFGIGEVAKVVIIVISNPLPSCFCSPPA